MASSAAQAGLAAGQGAEQGVGPVAGRSRQLRQREPAVHIGERGRAFLARRGVPGVIREQEGLPQADGQGPGGGGTVG